MASKRKLKKTMQYISSELISNVFFKSLVSENDITEKSDKLAMEIVDFTAEHIRRINHSGGKENPKVIKEYYKKLYDDWNTGVEKLIEKIGEL